MPLLSTHLLLHSLTSLSSKLADEHDEIDIELVGGDASHWQSNIYAPAPTDTEPLWGVFGQVEDYADGSVGEMHSYTIDWTEDRIVWSVDGKAVRTIKPGASCVSRIQVSALTIECSER